MKTTCFIFLLLICEIEFISAQKSYYGCFVMSFNDNEKVNDSPFLWNIEPTTTGGKMVLEIQDEMKIKGVSKRVLFNPSDSTWIMMIGYNQVKQGSRIHASSMFKDTMIKNDLSVIKTKEIQLIEGYRCKKINIESSKYSAEAWVWDKFTFDLCKMYRLLSHCGMMSDFVRKGDWYLSKKIDGMILRITSRNKLTGEEYTMNISQLKPKIYNDSLFSTEGYKIANIPEGLNCGIVKEEK